jgi:hypothetical protein
MSICIAVSILAKELEQQLTNITLGQKQMIGALKDAPRYCDERRLDLWEEAYKNALKDDEELLENFQLIDLVYELGAFNLFGAFDAVGTQNLYNHIVRQLTNKGLVVSKDFDVSKW